MRAKNWIFVTVLAFAIGLAAVLSFVAGTDIYGLFRNNQGRSLPAYGDQRIAKYLLCQRYVPANYDGLLIGPSITANWKPRLFSNYRIYNASVNGANIVELKALADQALQSGKIRIVLLLVHPSLTRGHEYQTVPLKPKENIAALGSQSLLDAYKDELVQNIHPEGRRTDGDGTEFTEEPKVLNAINIGLLRPKTKFVEDPIALRAYIDLLNDLRQRCIPTVLIVPPIAENLLARKPEAFAEFTDMIRSYAASSAEVFDFLNKEYKDFRSDPANFSDGIHLTRLGADRITSKVNERLKNLHTGSASLPKNYSDPAGPRSTNSIISSSGLDNHAILR